MKERCASDYISRKTISCHLWHVNRHPPKCHTTIEMSPCGFRQVPRSWTSCRHPILLHSVGASFCRPVGKRIAFAKSTEAATTTSLAAHCLAALPHDKRHNQQTQKTGAEPRPGQAKQPAKSHSLQVPDRDVDVSSLHPAKGQRVGKILAYTSETPVASLVRPVFVTNCQPRDPPLAIVLKLTVSDVNLLSGVLRNQHCAVACANGFSRCHISGK